MICLHTLGPFFFYFNVLYINDVYRMSLLEGPVWLYLFPGILFYILYALFGIIFFVLQTSKFANIRQKTILEKLNCLTLQISKGKPLPTKNSMCFFQSLLKLNQQAVELCADIEAFSRYWTPYLTLFFVACISVQSYLAYIFLFVPNLPFLERYIFLLGVLQLNLLLFFFIHYCAKVVKLNRQIEIVNGKFYLSFLQSDGLERSKSIQLILKVNNCQ